jgi:hypothetical protein
LLLHIYDAEEWLKTIDVCGGEFVVPFKVNRASKAVMWPAFVWVVTIVLFRVAGLAYPPAESQFTQNLYSIATTLGLVLAIWAGFAVKEAKGTYQEAIIGGLFVGLACGVPAVIVFSGTNNIPTFLAFAINMAIFSLAASWAGWELKH